MTDFLKATHSSGTRLEIVGVISGGGTVTFQRMVGVEWMLPLAVQSAEEAATSR